MEFYFFFFFEVKTQLKVVLDELVWDDLGTSEWRMLRSVVKLLQPFARLSSLLSGDECTTLSSVVPTIVNLSIHLEEVHTCMLKKICVGIALYTFFTCIDEIDEW